MHNKYYADFLKTKWEFVKETSVKLFRTLNIMISNCYLAFDKAAFVEPSLLEGEKCFQRFFIHMKLQIHVTTEKVVHPASG